MFLVSGEGLLHACISSYLATSVFKTILSQMRYPQACGDVILYFGPAVDPCLNCLSVLYFLHINIHIFISLNISCM